MFTHVDYVVVDEVTKLIVALLIGAIIGAEREYRTKSAGFRTVILITVGSTLFTIISNIMSNDARVASNIVTGIGFLGAGAIFKEGATVKGLTTATTIWISAAIGMAVGIGEYRFAFVALGIVMLVLLAFSWLPHMIESINTEILYRITLSDINPQHLDELKTLFRAAGVKSRCIKHKKHNGEMYLVYAIKASKKNHQDLIIQLFNHEKISYFDV